MRVIKVLLLILIPFASFAQQFAIPIGCCIVNLCPTCTRFDPANKGTFIVLTNADLTLITDNVNPGMSRATKKVVSGNKVYWEFTIASVGATTSVGIDNGTGDLNNNVGYVINSFGYVASGVIVHNGVIQSGLASYTTGDIIGIALDLSTNHIQWYKNGTAVGTNQAISSGDWWPAAGCDGQASRTTANFGNSTISGVPAGSNNAPSGFTIGVF